MDKKYTPNEVRTILRNMKGIQGQAYCSFDQEKAEEAERLFDAVMGAVNYLKEEEKEVIHCLYLNEMSWDETEKTLFVSSNTISRRKRKAIQNICNILNGEVI